MCDRSPSFLSPQIWSLGEILTSGCVSVLFMVVAAESGLIFAVVAGIPGGCNRNLEFFAA